MSLPSKRDGALRRAGVRPRIERSVVVLPAPLGPSSATTSPSPTVERYTEERLRLAVEGLDAGDVQDHGGAPSTDRCTHLFSRSASGVPPATTWPQWMTEIVSARPKRNCMSCSITTIE